MEKRDNGGTALALGGLATVLASACCIGPLLLLALGVSGAWIAHLAVLEPYRNLFIAAAAVALALAARRIFRVVPTCGPAELCAQPRWRRTIRWLFGCTVVLLLSAVAFPYLAPFFY